MTVASKVAPAACWISILDKEELVPTVLVRLTAPPVDTTREPGPSMVPPTENLPRVLLTVSVDFAAMAVVPLAPPSAMLPEAVLMSELAETVSDSREIPEVSRELMLPARVVSPPERVSPPSKAMESLALLPRVTGPVLERLVAPVTFRLPINARLKLLVDVVTEPAVSIPSSA